MLNMLNTIAFFVVLAACGKLAESLTSREVTESVVAALQGQGYSSVEAMADLEIIEVNGRNTIKYRKNPATSKPGALNRFHSVYTQLYSIASVQIGGSGAKRVVVLDWANSDLNATLPEGTDKGKVDNFVYDDVQGNPATGDIDTADTTGIQLLASILKSDEVKGKLGDRIKVGVGKNAFAGAVDAEEKFNYSHFVLVAEKA